MANDDEELTRSLANVTQITTLVGTMVSFDPATSTAQVDVGGGRIPAVIIGVIPQPNDDVHVWFIDGKPFIMGWSAPRPMNGTITAVGSAVVSVNTAAGVFSDVRYLGSAPAAGNIVALAWGDAGPVVMGVSSSTPVAPDVPPAPPDPSRTITTTFTATGSGSASDGKSTWWTQDVYASASSIGIFTYGSKLRSNLRGAKIRKVEIRLSAKRDTGNAPRLGSQPRESVAGSTPTVSNLRDLPRNFPQWIDITNLGPTLQAGGGIGFDGNGYAIFNGINADNQSGMLRITYTK